jgi:hypothetical protein
MITFVHILCYHLCYHLMFSFIVIFSPFFSFSWKHDTLKGPGWYPDPDLPKLCRSDRIRFRIRNNAFSFNVSYCIFSVNLIHLHKSLYGIGNSRAINVQNRQPVLLSKTINLFPIVGSGWVAQIKGGWSWQAGLIPPHPPPHPQGRAR